MVFRVKVLGLFRSIFLRECCDGCLDFLHHCYERRRREGSHEFEDCFVFGLHEIIQGQQHEDEYECDDWDEEDLEMRARNDEIEGFLRLLLHEGLRRCEVQAETGEVIEDLSQRSIVDAINLIREHVAGKHVVREQEYGHVLIDLIRGVIDHSLVQGLRGFVLIDFERDDVVVDEFEVVFALDALHLEIAHLAE